MKVKPASVWVWTIFAVMVVVVLAVWMQEVANVMPVVMGVAVMATIVIAVMEIAVIVAKIGVHVAVMVTKVIVVIGVPVMVICVAVMAMKVIVVIVVMGGVAKVSNVLNVFLTKGGCCKHSCLMKYHDLAQIRAHSLAALNKKTRKTVVLGMLALVQDNLGSRNVYHYRLDWSTPICMKAFCAVVNITYRTLQQWKQEMCSGSDIVPNAHGNSGRAPHHALSQLDKLTVVKFIKNYAAVHALPDPGRLQGKTRDFVLESSHTMKSLYGEYCKAVEVESGRVLPATQQPCPYRLTSQLRRQYTLLNVPTPDPTPPVPHKVSYPTFIRLWRKYCLNIKIQASRSDLCDKCDRALVTLRHSLSDAQRKAINDSYNQHLSKAKELRERYNANIEGLKKCGEGRHKKTKTGSWAT